MVGGDSLFVVHSPYQMLLSYSIAAETERESHMVVDPMFNPESAETLLKLVVSDGTFTRSQILEASVTPDGDAKPFGERKEAI